MWSARSLALHSAAREARGVPAAGPAMTVLGTMLTRIAAIIRGVAAGYVLVQVVIWHAFYQADPAHLWGPAIAVGWNAAAVWYLRRGRFPSWPLVCLDWLVYAGLALAAGGCVPLEIRGQAAEWLFVTVAGALLVQVWFTPARLSMPLSLASGLAFWAGSVLAPGLHTARGARAASVALLFVVVAVHWCGRQLLYQRASRADRALASADRDARDQFVILSRTVERREHDRLLHDTVLNTLTAVARSGPAGGVVSRCQQDLARLERALNEPADPAGAFCRRIAELAADLHAVAGEMRARGLTVHLERAPGPVPPGQAVPVPVAVAIVHAAREALANVAAHAGTGEAWVTVRSLVTAAGPAAGVEVTVRDEGAGFDPARLGPARLGVRRSITERVRDCGGSAAVRSTPGAGTEVRLCWPAQPEPAPENAAASHQAGPC
jgi:signal transduction histidine kinase